jgi:hypothetical protein
MGKGVEMPSKYGFESDADRQEKEKEFREHEKLKKQTQELARKDAQAQRIGELSHKFGGIDALVSDILNDFAEASPSYFADNSNLLEIVKISGSVRDLWQKQDNKNAIDNALRRVDYGKEGEEIFHTWIVANSIAVMLCWVGETAQAGFKIIKRGSGVPEEALRYLCFVLEKKTGLWCERIELALATVPENKS